MAQMRIMQLVVASLFALLCGMRQTTTSSQPDQGQQQRQRQRERQSLLRTSNGQRRRTSQEGLDQVWCDDHLNRTGQELCGSSQGQQNYRRHDGRRGECCPYFFQVPRHVAGSHTSTDQSRGSTSRTTCQANARLEAQQSRDRNHASARRTQVLSTQQDVWWPTHRHFSCCRQKGGSGSRAQPRDHCRAQRQATRTGREVGQSQARRSASHRSSGAGQEGR